MKKKYIVMLGTSYKTNNPGGIWSVTNIYRHYGLFDRWPIIYLATHKAGNSISKLIIFCVSLFKFILLICIGKVYLLHVHSSRRASFWRKSIFILMAFFAKKNVILHLHSGGFYDFYEGECGPIKKRIIKFIFDNVDKIVVLSNQMKRILIEVSNNADFVCIYNPVIINEKVNKTNTEKVNKKSFVIIFLGRLETDKGIFDLLNAITILKQHYPDIKLFCGGIGNFKEIHKFIINLKINKSVELCGWIDGERKNELFRKADVYVLPSYSEGLPMGVLEAMAAGLPVVATNVGGIPEAVEDGIEGFLVNPGDIEGIVQAISKLIEDEELRVKMGSLSKKKAETKFAVDQIIPQIETLYYELNALPCNSKKNLFDNFDQKI